MSDDEWSIGHPKWDDPILVRIGDQVMPAWEADLLCAYVDTLRQPRRFWFWFTGAKTPRGFEQWRTKAHGGCQDGTGHEGDAGKQQP